MTPGTNSTAIQNADGTWDVLDISVVHDGSIGLYNQDGEKVDEFQTDSEWFQRVLAVHARAETEGRMGRAFIDHHEDGESSSQPDAGFIRPTRIGEIQVEGVAKAALFVNLTSIPDDVYQSWVKTGRLAGRSIESLVAASGWIDGLALMPTRPAHYKLPMLTIGEEIVPGETSHSGGEPLQAVACASVERSRAIFAQETAMSDADKILMTGKAPDGSLLSFKAPLSQIKAMDKKDDEEKKDDEPPMAKGEGDGEDTEKKPEGGGESKGSGWKAKLEALKGCNLTAEEIPEVVAAITEFASTLEGGGEVDMPDMPEMDDVEEPAISEPVADQVMAGKDSSAVIKAQAEATAARTESASLKARMDRNEAVAEAVEALQDYNLGSDPKAHLMAKAKEHGLKGLKLYVDSVKAHGTKSPGLGAELDVPSENATDVPAFVMAYTDPAEQTVALKALRRAQSHQGAGFSMSDGEVERLVARDVKRARIAR